MHAMKFKPAGAPLVLETLDGRAYLGDTVAQCIRAMRRDAWACDGQTMQQYMQGVARRAMQWCKAPVRHDTAENFINDLQQAGLITLMRAS